jgi:hypothetical protein
MGDQAENNEIPAAGSSPVWTAVKLFAAGAFVYAAVTKSTTSARLVESSEVSSPSLSSFQGRRLQAVGDEVPSYMEPLMKDLVARKKLFEDTPPEEVKYWFEYAGPLQVSRE